MTVFGSSIGHPLRASPSTTRLALTLPFSSVTPLRDLSVARSLGWHAILGDGRLLPFCAILRYFSIGHLLRA
jgi:hypothetical protein